jgi:Spy/CpxP family protein refolding chaperone
MEMAMRDVTAAAPQAMMGSWALRWAAVGVLVIAAAGAAVNARAQGMMGGHGPHGPGGMDMMFGGPPEHMGRGIDHMLDGLNATDAQRTQIKQIAMAAAADLKAQREAGKGLREKGMQIFAAPSVDAGAAEALRQQMLTQHDQASKRVLQAMLDVSKVLTPEQRAKIGERMKQRQTIMQERMQREQREHHDRPQK